MGPWRTSGFPVNSGRLLELDPPVFSHAPPQGQHVSAKEMKILVSKCTKGHGILGCHGSSIPASLYIWETEPGFLWGHGAGRGAWLPSCPTPSLVEACPRQPALCLAG